ncbi:glycosyltransferase [Halocatena salina]|uniref:Glycosyltransferase family 2 protein n=1 Tax=Halocatena salina TaxID=2934340 RepID=A0A8U0A595_9EURY|nr:glycosyltransferase family 2 protein [Halocatena salina]UPM44380.1 glycosyltransferase family 2 protein [Halocatena salina]
MNIDQRFIRVYLRRWFGRLCFLSLSSVIFTFELVRGLSIITIHLDLIVISFIVVTLQAGIAAVSFTGMVSLSAVVFFVQLLIHRNDSTEASEMDERSMTAIVPVYKDADVLDLSVTSLLESTVPVTVCVVCESDDQPSIDRATTLASDHEAVKCLINTRYPGSKAGAINYAVEQTSSPYISVFDADESVHPRFLESALTELSECDVVQGRTVPRASGLIEAIAYYESILLSYITSRLLSIFVGFRLAASRAVVMHRDTFETVGGYDPTMLTEDYDFAYRCYKHGFDVHEQLYYASTIEAAHTVDDWWGQRKRWMSGYAQVCHMLLREWFPPRDLRSVLSIGICIGSVFGNLLLLSLTAKFVVVVLFGDTMISLGPFLAVITITALVRCVDYLQGRVDRLGWEWILTPIIFPLYGLVATKAITEYAISGVGDWYHVEKTGH